MLQHVLSSKVVGEGVFRDAVRMPMKWWEVAASLGTVVGACVCIGVEALLPSGFVALTGLGVFHTLHNFKKQQEVANNIVSEWQARLHKKMQDPPVSN